MTDEHENFRHFFTSFHGEKSIMYSYLVTPAYLLLRIDN
jgi:hypothetical protein